jgi:hypothetical protein
VNERIFVDCAALYEHYKTTQTNISSGHCGSLGRPGKAFWGAWRLRRLLVHVLALAAQAV